MVRIKRFQKGKHIYKKWGKKFKEVTVMSEDKAQNKQQIQIKIDDDVAQGVYANLATISHSQGEFTFDFIYLQPQAPKGKVRARVVTSPSHAKRFSKALQDNIAKHEARFGAIKASEQLDNKIGF